MFLQRATPALFGILLILQACSGSDAPTGSEAPVATVTVTPATATIQLGGQVLLTATPRDANGDVLSRQVTWSTSDGGVATVSAGTVMGVGIGSATIVAATEGKSGTAEVTVTGVPGGSVHLSVDAVTMVLDATAKLSAEVRDESGNLVSGASVLWTTTDPTVATVDSAGIVSAVALGTATISGTSEGNTGSATVTVTTVRFSTVVAGHHTCGITTTGGAFCWGAGEKGELGHGRNDSTPVPVPVLGDEMWQSIAPGGWHTCGVTTAGEALCWGYERALGIGGSDTSSHFALEPVHGGLTFRSVVSGGGHTCGLAQDNTGYCWGDHVFGVGATPDEPVLPLPVLGDLTYGSLAASAEGGPTCGVTGAGDAYCWGGWNGEGQMGIGSSDGNHHPDPELVVGGLTFDKLSIGSEHTCGITTAGTAYCWGGNRRWQLGTNTTEACMFGTSCSSSPIAVTGGVQFADIAAGSHFTCGIDTSGQLFCWGDIAPQDGFVDSTLVPMGTGLSFTSLTAGGYHVCGIAGDNVAYCWGTNWDGRVGVGNFDQIHAPTKVKGQP
jgi:alpha-tubulin suppressor-like RCC1 family protein